MIVIPNATHSPPVILSLSLLWAGRQKRQRLQKQALHNSLSRLVWFGSGEGEGEGRPSDGSSDRGTEPENGCATPHWFR